MTTGAEAVLLLDVGGSSVKAVAVGPAGVLAEASTPLVTHRPDALTAEMDPHAWWAATCATAARVTAEVGPREWLGVVPSSLRQGYVLLDREGAELGPGVLNSDRRGVHALDRVRAVEGLETLTGHWPAPELTLPKLLRTAEVEPERWAATQRVLFLHDWLVWRLCGEQVSEASYVCAGQTADVAARGWATDLLEHLGLGSSWCAPVVEAGAALGSLTATGLGLPPGTPVVAGCGDTQLAAAGAGGLRVGAVTVVVGSSTPVVAAAPSPPAAAGGPWVSTHARADLWAVETNCGYPGAMSGWAASVGLTAAPSGRPGAGGVLALTATPQWSERSWSQRPPMTLTGMTPSTAAGDVAQALAEAHAYAVRGNVTDLARALGAEAPAVTLAGGAGAAALAPLVATVLGRSVAVAEGSAAQAAWVLVTGDQQPAPTVTVEPAGDPGDYAEPYSRWRAAYESSLPVQG